MIKFKKSSAFGAVLLAAASLTAAPVLAQRAPATPVVATADIDAAVQQSAAFTAAVAQIQTTYAPQIQARSTRAQALQTEIQGLQAAAVTEQNRQPRNNAAYETAVRNFQTRNQAAQQELQNLSAPIDASVTYVREQITLRLADAVRTASAARRVDVLLNSDAVVWRNDAIDMTAAIVTELNRLVPNVQIVPPAGYEPGSLLRAQQAAQPARPATPAAPQTR